MVLAVQADHETPQLLEDKVVDAPSAHVVQVVDIPVVPQRLIPMDLLTIEIPLKLFLDKVIDDPGVRVVQVSQRYRFVLCWLRRGGPPENFTVFRAPRGILLVMRALPSGTGSYCDSGCSRPLVAPRCTSREHFTVFAAPRGTVHVVGFSPMVQLPPAPLVFECNSVWAGQRYSLSVSVDGLLRRWFYVLPA